ncbi:MAG TPA: C25 family cysteine peptidase, partial [Myxococcaceae bacterium]
LAGSGTLQSGSGPIVVASGGRYTVGSGGAGNFTTNDLTLNDTSSLTFTVGTATTQGIVNGALIHDGILNINPGAGFAQGTFTLFTATGAITNNSLRQGSAPTGFSYDYQVSGNTVLLKVGPAATAVELVKMEAVTDGTSTAVTWEAGTEIRNLGYRVYREENGRRREVSGLIAGAALRARSDSFAGRNYAFVDPGARFGARYWVEALDLKGQSQWLGPVDVVRGPSSKVRVRSAALLTQRQPAALLASDPGSTGRPVDPPGLDRSLRDLDQQRQWRVAASNGAVKLLVRQDGVYRVSADQLFQAGLPAGTSLGNVQLWRGGRPVGFRAVSANGKSLQPGDALEFFGQAADTRYTDAHVYWVTAGLGSPLSIRPAPPVTATATASSFLETLEVRQRTLHITALQNPDTNEFFGPPIIGTTPLERVFSTPALSILSTEPAVLEVSVQGLTKDLHALDVTVNGLRVGTIRSVFQDVATARFTLPPGTLVPGDNKVDLVGETGSEIALEVYQRLTYPRLYAFSGPLRFIVPAGQDVLLSGADASTHVLDVTSALNPASLAGTPSGGSLRLTASGAGTRILYAYRDQDVLIPTVVANIPSAWHDSDGGDLVIIGARSLLPSLGALAQQRVAEGLGVAVVDIEDVYDEFSAGEKDALAIRNFLAAASLRWAVAPRFVLLAGAATYDPRGWLGQPELDQVPTVTVQTQVQEAPSDDALVTFDAAAGPALAIGRLPMSTPAEMDAAVAKILGRRIAAKNDELLLVRDRDGTSLFSSASAEVEAALSGWKAQEFARGPDDAANHAALLDALRSGPVVVDYQGHGTEDLWNGRMLSSADVDALAGAGNSSLFVAATCLNAYFIDFDRESLGAALLRTPSGGAWGIWANSAFSNPTEHALFSKTVLSAVLNDGLTLGEASLKAKQVLTDPEVRSTFHLLGDPSAHAVATRSAALTVASPRAGGSGCSTSGGPLSVVAPVIVAVLALAARRRRQR